MSPPWILGVNPNRFYNGLNKQDQDSLNVAARGNLLSKMTREALKIIENKSKVRYSRSKLNVSRVNTNSRDSASKTDDRIDKLADKILNLVEIVNKQVITPATAKVVEKTCVICGGAHAYYDCIATDSNQPSVFAATGTYNQVSPQNQASYQIPPPGFAPMQNNPNSNIVPNPKGEMKVVTTRSGLAYEGPSIPTNSSFEKVVELNTEEIMDKEHSNCQGSTAHIQPPVVPISILEPDVPRTQPKPTIPYPSRLNDQKLREKSLLTNKDKLFKLAKVPLNENCSAMLLKKLLEKLGDPGKFLIPCDFSGIDVCHSLADLGASINLMPLSIWKNLSLPELTPTRMTLELADRSITHFEADPRVPLILGRSFLGTGRALIDVYGEEITLRVNDESYNSKNSNPTLVSNPSNSKSESCKEPIVKSSLATLTPFGESDLFLEEIEDFLNDESIPTGIDNSFYDPEGDILYLEKFLNEDLFQLPPMDIKQAEETKAKSSIEEPPMLELKELTSHKVLKSHKRAIAWKISDIKGIDSRFCTHKILMEEDYKPAVQSQRRVNPKIHDVIKKEVIKLLDAGMIYPISNSSWVSPIHCVPKKGGMTIVANENNELIPTSEDTSKRRSFGSRTIKDGEKPYLSFNQDRSASCKFPTLKIVLVILVLGAIFTLLHSPAVYNTERPSHLGSRSSLVERSIAKKSLIDDERYTSHVKVNWNHISGVIQKLPDANEYKGIGLLNFNETEIKQWKKIIPDADHISLHLDSVGETITWEDLYPEWIDEEEEFKVPVCLKLPNIKAPRKPRIDFIAVKLPCLKTRDWSRDVARLHLQLAAARLAAKSKGYRPVRVLLVTDCFPVPNLFTCKELVVHRGDVWLYKPDLNKLREKVQLPVGSCELSVPLNAKDYRYLGNPKREAYATILHSAQVYVCGAITAAQSIPEKDAYNEYNYSKFRLWQLTNYDKIIFIDADLLILRNIDFLFEMPEITAIGNNATLFNSGVMVIEPSNCTFKLLMDHINEIESYNGGDQGYLNEIFTWWHRIPKHMNFLKHFWEGDEEEKKVMKTRLFGADPPVLYVLHYLGLKPWLCFRDYDCNWNVAKIQEFASDVAHARWWKVHDAMPENLHKYCLLRSKQKAALEWDRRQAEKANYSDGHWKINITDSRLETCYESFCFWESMLWHWGETNWTDNSTTNALAPPVTVALPSL
nr:putative UDP-glucuronate:xylan alpha-glucuronosyltransferase 3 [Tanacetum cinerariifolium]